MRPTTSTVRVHFDTSREHGLYTLAFTYYPATRGNAYGPSPEPPCEAYVDELELRDATGAVVTDWAALAEANGIDGGAEGLAWVLEGEAFHAIEAA